MSLSCPLVVLLMLGLFFQEDVPYRENETYKITIDYNFKNKPPPPKDHVSFTEPTQQGPELLPYLKVKLDLLKLEPHDFRVKIVNDRGVTVTNKRLKGPMEVSIDMGFTEDLKDRIVPHLYNIYFLNQDKDVTSKLILEVTESGEMMINKGFFGQL